MQSCTSADLLDGERHQLFLGELLRCVVSLDVDHLAKGLGFRVALAQVGIAGAEEGRLASDHVQRKVRLN